MKIHTFNKDRDRVKLGVDTIERICIGLGIPLSRFFEEGC